MPINGLGRGGQLSRVCGRTSVAFVSGRDTGSKEPEVQPISEISFETGCRSDRPGLIRHSLDAAAGNIRAKGMLRDQPPPLK